MWQIWLIFAGVFIIIEFFTAGFLVFWFSIGSLFAMITSFFTDNLIIQTSVFVISSTLLIFTTKPFVEKFAKIENTIKTNVYSNVGRTGIVTKTIDSELSSGQVKIGGETWTAISQDNSKIPEGTKVEIKEIKGVKAIVTPIEK